MKQRTQLNEAVRNLKLVQGNRRAGPLGSRTESRGRTGYRDNLDQMVEIKIEKLVSNKEIAGG